MITVGHLDRDATSGVKLAESLRIKLAGLDHGRYSTQANNSTSETRSIIFISTDGHGIWVWQ